MFDCRKALRVACAVWAVLGCHGAARAQAPLSGEVPPAPAQVLEITPSLLPDDDVAPYDLSPRKSNSYPAGDYAAQLSTASGDNPYGCDWGWGCGGSPYRTGPGRCDNWRVGPVWKVEVDGLIMFHEDAPIDALVARSNDLQVPPSDAVPDYTENFGEAPGVRIAATSYWPQCAGYEINITYTGIPNWDASAVFPETLVFVEEDDELSIGTEQRLLTYNSAIHSLELNFIPFHDSPWKRFLGIRYILLDENIRDEANQFGQPPIEVDEELILTDFLRATVVENHMIGFQGGIRRDMWRFRPWLFVEGFANGGVYCNVIKREDIQQETRIRQVVVEQLANNVPIPDRFEVITTINEERNVVKTSRSQIAFAGEAELALVCKLNRCLALRSGYQAIMINGVELADDAFINFDSNPERESRFYHGFFGGLEYRR
ncbi:MAG: hypothetical protein WD851_19235 [Pirellulales bacterium]